MGRVEPGDRGELRITGRLVLDEARSTWDELRRHLREPGSYEIDLSGVERLDGAGAALLLALQSDVQERGGYLTFSGADEDAAKLLGIYGAGLETRPVEPPARPGFLHQVGAATVDFVVTAREILAFVGELTLALGGALRKPSSVHWADVGRLMERAGADGVAIVVLINFLVGLILALQSALQLQNFGAGIYVADLVGKGMTRELAPLMTAIIVAGRSGAAYAAELGTMKVSEEIDALRTLGLNPLRFLVVPRMLALALMVPILTLLADFVGCIGGWLIALGVLDLTTQAYTHQLYGALTLWDVFGGTIKAVVFAGAIALIACQRGLATRGGAAGVGTSTTSAVVVALFLLVLLDFVFTMVFTALDI